MSKGLMSKRRKRAIDKQPSYLKKGHNIPFPIDVFPPVIKDYIESCHNSLNLIPDFMGIGALSVAATLIGNSYRIQIKEGWMERPLFWMAIVGHSGIRKTPSLDAMIRPLQLIDKTMYTQYLEELEKYQSKKTESDSKTTIPKQLVVTDSTIEALIPILKDNSNGILYFKDELIGWINDLCRYNKGSAEQQWLSLYSNQPIRLNRKTEGDHVRVDNPFANVIGGIQPDILPSLFENGRGINGFTSRIIFSYPDSVKRKLSHKNMKPHIVRKYDHFISRLFDLEKNRNHAGKIEPITLEFSDSAQERFYTWDEVFINNHINDPTLPEAMKSALSKLEALMPRLALVIQFMEEVAALKEEPKEVSLDATNKAIQLIDYFYAHFLKVYGKVNNGAIHPPNREHLLLKNFAKDVLNNYQKEDIIKKLLASGFNNAEISRALETPKSNISYWAKN